MGLWGILARNPALLDVLFVAGVVLVFGRSWRGGWVFDDWAIVDEEPDFKKPLWSGRIVPFVYTFRRPFSAGGGRPVTYIVYAITYKLFGFQLEAWHAVNLAMHAAAVVLLHRLALSGGIDPTAAAGWAAVFAFHPLQVSTVCYISGRPGLQSVLLTLAGLLCFQLGAWPAALVFQYLAWKSKEDSILYWVFYPICYFLFTSTAGIMP